ncbi:hypothetical protein HJG60_007938 [Phyllostomus discolor]|uniref:Uncharacterized protein n=1 Tax=Phyllostomus discolor TaxID=89673 RepID=A0A834EVC5_9CHIR|nr:hypothetical protein HJG60_007938 [Phyllostomus discolor]
MQDFLQPGASLEQNLCNTYQGSDSSYHVHSHSDPPVQKTLTSPQCECPTECPSPSVSPWQLPSTSQNEEALHTGQVHRTFLPTLGHLCCQDPLGMHPSNAVPRHRGSLWWAVRGKSGLRAEG